MSRGPGVLQRNVVDLLSTRRAGMTVAELADRTQRSSRQVRQAVAGLTARGVAEYVEKPYTAGRVVRLTRSH